MDWFRKRTLGSLLDEAAEIYGDREALVFGEQRSNYTALKTETDRIAKGLMAIGVEPGERVALWMTNRPEWLYLMFAIAKVGACIVPLNTRYRSDDVAYTINQSRSATLISLDCSGPIDFQDMLAESMESISPNPAGGIQVGNYPELRRVVILGEKTLPHALDWQELIEAGSAINDAALATRTAAVDPDSLMMLAYTSGTTGHPKGVMHSHIAIRNTLERSKIFGYSATDVHLNYLPMFHIYAFSEIAMVCVLSGGKQILTETFNAEQALDLAVAEGVTILHGFEAHWIDLLNAQAREPRTLKLRLGTLPSGIESTIPIAEKVQDVFCPTVSGFGMSETWAFVSCSNPGHSREQRVHASGYPMSDYHFRIIDPDTGSDLPAATPGELLVKGYAVMKGYWDKPEATQETIDAQGWLHTGDMALIRDDGHLVFLGRHKDMLKVGGENVSPAEIELRLRDMPEIADASVVAYPDQRLTEVPVAFVILNPDQTLAQETILARMKGRIASFKIPRQVMFVDAFPMTSSGKIRKVELRAQAMDILENT
ncbi:MAG: AMP-binding protein [Candidatus Reddybacter sp.]